MNDLPKTNTNSSATQMSNRRRMTGLGSGLQSSGPDEQVH